MSSPEDDNIDVSQRLRQVRSEIGATQAEVADEVGVKQQTWGGYERGKSNPSIKVLQKLAVSHRINLDWLLTGRGEMLQSDIHDVQATEKPYMTQELPEDFDPDDVAFVPVYGAPLGAGNSGNAAMVDVRGYMAWEKTWLRREAHIKPSRAFVAQVFGQSMMDLLENGDLVLGEMQASVDHDGIYAIRWGDELYIKHVVRRKDSILLISENDVYGRTEIGRHEDFDVIGRIVVRISSL